MHPTIRWSPVAFLHILLALGIGVLAVGMGAAQEVLPSPRPEVTPPATPGPRRGGNSNVIIVSIGGSQRLQMRGRQAIDSVVNEKENVLTVTPVPGDPTTITLTGREAGVSRLTLTGADKTVERYEVIVQLDVEYLRTVLQRAAPTASLELIPAAAGTVIVAGTVTRAEDIDVILRTAAGVVGAPERVVNGLRVEGVQQVQLDVVIADVNRGELRQMAFNFITTWQHGVFTGTITPPGSASLAAAPAGTTTALGLFNGPDAFFAFLQALRTDSLAKILAEPKVMTLSGRSATFVAGGDQAVPELTGGGIAATTGVRFEPFGVRVSVLPIVLGNGRIQLEIEAEDSTLSNNPLAAAAIPGTANTVAGRTADRVHTTVIMADGQTYALGGLIENNVTANTVKVPVLGDLPFVGVFFSSKSYNELEHEVIIVVTPHLVDAMACNQAPKIFPGQETRRPDDFELFLEGILEAPRGPREICVNKHYVPAWRNSPSASVYPCSGPGCGLGVAAEAVGPEYPGTAPALVEARPATPVMSVTPAQPMPVPVPPATAAQAAIIPAQPVMNPTPAAAPVAIPVAPPQAPVVGARGPEVLAPGSWKSAAPVSAPAAAPMTAPVATPSALPAAVPAAAQTRAPVWQPSTDPRGWGD